MSSSVADRCVGLSPAAQHVLAAMVLLDQPTADPDALAPALGWKRADLTAVVDELAERGWLDADPVGTAAGSPLTAQARIWLRYDAPRAANTWLIDDRVRQAIAARVIQLHTGKLDTNAHGEDKAVEWAARHKADIVAAIRAGTLTELDASAVQLATRAWAVAAQVPDSGWWRDLARHGSRAAARIGDAAAYFALVSRTASVLENGGDLLTAEDHWIQAQTLAYQLDDHNRVIATTTALVALYRKAHRPEMIMETLLDLANAHHAAGDVRGRADALIDLADVNLEFDRPEWARTYYDRAEQLLREASIALPPARVAHALEQRGRALWQVGSPVLARRAFRAAVDILADRDPHTTGRLRELLAVHADAPTLPDRCWPTRENRSGWRTRNTQ